VKPGPWNAFVLATRLCGLALVVLAWRAGWPWGLTLGTFALVSLGRVPQRRLLVELAIVALVLGLRDEPAYDLPALGMAGASLLALLFAPEASLLRLNGMDRFFIAQDYPGTPTNSHTFLELSAPLDRAALEAAVADLHREVPLFRSFVRESAFGVERFVARRPFGGPLLQWLDVPTSTNDDAVLHAPFDLARQPPFRVLHAPEGDKARLVMTTHHSASDGQGMLISADWLLQRYGERRAGKPPTPLALTKEGVRLRDVVRARGKSIVWLLQMVRRHVKPSGKVGERNAELHDDANAAGVSTRWHTDWIEPARWQGLSRLASGQELTRNDLLVAASLRAADRFRRERGREDRPFRLLLPANLRPQLGLPPGLQNFLGVVNASFSVAEVRSTQLATIVHGRVQQGRELEEVIETPIHLGTMSLLLPPWLLRRALRKLDHAPGDNYFSFMFSHWRHAPPRPLADVTLERLSIRGSLSRRPPIGLVLVPERDGLAITLEYRYPLVVDASARAFVAAFRAEVDEMLQTPMAMRTGSPGSSMPSG
jgi:hypothetical protein